VTPRVVGEIQGHANEKERETGMITPRTTKTNEAAIVQVLETEATAVKLRSRGTVTPNVYVAGETRSMTKEQAAAQALEDNPEVYEAYRRAHNAGPCCARFAMRGNSSGAVVGPYCADVLL